MLFNSIQFLIFFPIVCIIYFLIPYKYRWIHLLIASCYFYMCWKAEYMILLLIAIVIDYFCVIQIEKNEKVVVKKFFLIICLVSNFGILFLFKYFNFINNSLRDLFNKFNIFYNVPAFKLLLPVGISFYTFQAISYVMDVYRKDIKAETHFGKFFLYIVFFPQLVAGPIERSTNLLPQFYKNFDFNAQRITDGLKIMLWGFFKKVVIADRLCILVNQVYNNAHDYTGFPLIIATYFFAFQIYCDFSGYSDIAIGAAQVLGFKLMDNFRRPYFSKTIREFWQRWHISLSTWFKDYLYIPLGGNRKGKFRMYINFFIVFFVSGIWHGANWTFVIWGSMHGILTVINLLTQRFRDKIYGFFKVKYSVIKIIRVFFTFHLVLFTWIFFRANNLNDAIYIVKNFFNFNNGQTLLSFFNPDYAFDLGLTKYEIILSLLLILFMESVHLIQRHNKMRQFLSEKPVFIRWAIYYILIFAILLFGSFSLQEFIYFQF